MADVRPLRGLRYNPLVTGNLSRLLCPPYDIIPPTQQRQLYEHSPYNAIRLELAEARPGDTETDNRYTRTAATFQEWLDKNVLVHDNAPAMYLVEETFTFSWNSRQRLTLMACMRLEEFGKGSVYPHEHTTEGPKRDRLELMKACAANFSPILSLYPDQDSSIAQVLARAMEGPPDASTEPVGEVAYRLWIVQDGKLLSKIRAAMKARPLYLADGHHRYETALRYRDILKEQGRLTSDKGAANFVMMGLVSLGDPGLLVLPYHRLLGGLSPAQEESLWNRMREMFELEEISLPSSASPKEVAPAIERRLGEGDPTRLAMGIFSSAPGQTLVATLKAAFQPSAGSPPLERCDPWLVQERLLKKALDEKGAAEAVAFVHDAAEAIEGVQRGRHQMALLLRPVPLPLFEEIVSKGQRLPPKSTYFYPKLPTGLVFHHLEGELE